MQAVSLLVSIWIYMVLQLAIWIPVSEQSTSARALKVRLFLRLTQEVELLILIKYT